MKLRQTHVQTFKGKVQELDESLPNLLKVCDDWLEIQKERETYGNTDNEWAAIVRDKLEVEFDSFRERIGAIYDFMAERGLRDIEAVK